MNWKESENTLSKTYTFPSFLKAMEWMGKAAEEIDRLDHHPQWTNTYNRVEVVLTTHSAGNKVTEKDRSLAEILDRIYLALH